MYKAKTVDDYLHQHLEWSAELLLLKALLDASELEACIIVECAGIYA